MLPKRTFARHQVEQQARDSKRQRLERIGSGVENGLEFGRRSEGLVGGNVGSNEAYVPESMFLCITFPFRTIDHGSWVAVLRLRLPGSSGCSARSVTSVTRMVRGGSDCEHGRDFLSVSCNFLIECRILQALLYGQRFITASWSVAAYVAKGETLKY